MRKIKLFFYGDSPISGTGFGTVARNILEQLYNTGNFDITVLAINYHGGWDSSGLVERYKMQRAGNNPYRDMFGAENFVNAVAYGEFDIVLSLHNLNSPAIVALHNAIKEIRKVNKKPFKWIHYFPLDGEFYPAWGDVLLNIDVPVCYLNFARDKILRACPAVADKLQTIPHGVNTKDYFPERDRQQEYKNEILGKRSDRFLVTNINRFMQRKDVTRTLLIFKEFKKLVPDAVLYPHCSYDRDEMGCIGDHALALGMTDDDLLVNDPATYNHNTGYSIAGLRRIYGASDVIMSTTLGEGWGFSCTEAMASKVPVLFPRNTSLPELIGGNEERGYLMESGKTISEWVVMPEDNGTWRPLTNVESGIEKLYHIYKHQDEARAKAEIAYRWVTDLSWENVCKLWQNLIYKELGL